MNLVENNFKTKNKITGISNSSDNIEFLLILFLMFVPLNNIGNIFRLVLTITILLKRLLFNSDFNIYINKNIIYIIRLMLLGVILPIVPVLFVDKDLNFSLWFHEFSRIIFYIILLIIIPSITVTFRFVFNSSIVILLFHTLIQLVQKFSLFDVNSWLEKIYLTTTVRESHLVLTTYVGSGFRSGSIFINPNVYMVIPCVVLCLILQSNIIKKSIINYLLCGLLFISVILTGSRTCLLVTVTTVFIYSIYDRSFSTGKRIFLTSLIFVLLVYFILKHDISNLIQNYRAFNVTGGIEGSYLIKIKLFIEYLRQSNPFLWVTGGLGSEASSIHVDFELGYLFQFYGIVGLLWYYKLIVRNPIHRQEYFSFFTLSSKLVILLIALTATIVFCLPIYPFVCLLLFSNILLER